MRMGLHQGIADASCRPLLVVCIAIALGDNSWAADMRGNANTKSQHWAFQPLDPPSLPLVRDPSFTRTAVDVFVQPALKKQGLRFAPRADRAILLRRLSFDLTGLPPTPEQIAECSSDAAPDALSRWIDRLLASPDYGQRWGKQL